MDGMHAYPGRTFGQLYHRFFRSNDLADGRLALTGRTLDLADVARRRCWRSRAAATGSRRCAACHHVGELLPGAPSVQLETAPGGHLGVLTGRAARGTTWALLDRFLAEHEALPARSARRRRPARSRLSPRRAATLLPCDGRSRSSASPSRCRRSLASAASAQVPPPGPGAAHPRRRHGLRRRRRQPHARRGAGQAGADARPGAGAGHRRDRRAASSSRCRCRDIKFAFRADKTALRALYAGQAAPPAPDGTLPPASAVPSVRYKRSPRLALRASRPRRRSRRAARRARADHADAADQAARPQGRRLRDARAREARSRRRSPTRSPRARSTPSASRSRRRSAPRTRARRTGR